MIRNQRQYRISRAWARRFTDNINRLEAAPLEPGAARKLRELELRSLRAQLASLQAELTEYEQLFDATTIRVDDLHDLGPALVKARNAAQISQADLASRLGVTPRVIQRYESNDYRQASLARLIDVAAALGLHLDAELTTLSA